MKRTHIGRAAAVLVTGAALTATALAQNGQPPNGETVFAMQWTSLDKMVVDARDQGVKTAVGMIPARVAELPAEIPDMPPEVSALLNMALTTIGKPARLAVQYNANNQSGGGMGYGFVLSSLAGNKGDADDIHAQISALLAHDEVPFKPAPSTRFEGMLDIQTPIGLVSFGPRQAEDGWRYEIIFGTVVDPSSAFADMPEFKGIDPVIQGKGDLSQLTPIANFAAMMAGNNPEVQQYLQQFTEMGLIGEDALRMSYVSGFTPDASAEAFVMKGARAHADALSISTEPLTADDFHAIPADAVIAGMKRADLHKVDQMLEQMKTKQPEVGEFLDRFVEETGVDLQADIIRSIGGTVGFYMSDSTGGGGLLSSVVFVKLADRDRFLEAHAKLLDLANALLDQEDEVGRYVDLRPWSDGDTQLVSLTFNGVPIPLEVTYAVQGNWLVLGATPQAALAAARQIAGKGDGGLMTNPRFAAGIAHQRQSIAVGFLDTPRIMSGGYGLVSLLGSGLANLARSPHDPTRQPGMVVPVYNDLARNAQPIVMHAYWDGDDLVKFTRADRSVLVNAAGIGGAAMKVLPFLAAGIGIAAGAENGPWAEGDLAPELRPLVWRAATGDVFARVILTAALSQEGPLARSEAPIMSE